MSSRRFYIRFKDRPGAYIAIRAPSKEDAEAWIKKQYRVDNVPEDIYVSAE